LARSALGPPTLMRSRPGSGVGMGVGWTAGGAGTWGGVWSFRKTSAEGRKTAGPRGLGARMLSRATGRDVRLRSMRSMINVTCTNPEMRKPKRGLLSSKRPRSLSPAANN
jgi:hypothetical protein